MRVPGEGPVPCRLMLISEAAGKWEEKLGRPFVGDAGEELNRYLHTAGLRREDFYITNVVKFRPPGNRDPTQAEIDEGREELNGELKRVQPEVIGTLGRISTRVFLGDVDMEVVHGLPHGHPPFTIVPTYHPAAGLHNIAIQPKLQWDFQQLANVIKHPEKEWKGPSDQYPDPLYQEWDDSELHTGDEFMPFGNYIAIDTEGTGDWCWGLSWCVDPGKAVVIRSSSKKLLKGMAEILAEQKISVVLHNSLHDIPVLRRMGIDLIARKIPFVDSMILAYQMVVEPQGLKALARRHCGMEMSSYDEIVSPAQEALSLDYLLRASKGKWPPSTEILVFDPKTGEPHVKKPWAVDRRISRILSDYAKDPDIDLRKRWLDGVELEVRAPVEKKLDRMPAATLFDIDQKVAVKYSGRDADATNRVWDKLLDRFTMSETALALTIASTKAGRKDPFSAFKIDMNVIPMVERMQSVGLPINEPYFETLSWKWQAEIERLGVETDKLAGRHINPESGDQVAKLLFHELKLKPKRLTKSRKRESTDDKVLESVRNDHPIVPLILDHRELIKLKGTYCDKIPTFAREGRVYPNYRVTRVPTGRLSCSDPNLMAIPVRTEIGRQIRAGFQAPKGRIFGTWDLSQIEIRIAAHESKDPVLCKLLNEGRDIHTETCCHIFKIPRDQFDKKNTDHMEKRGLTKNINFGIFYGITAQGLLDQLHQRRIYDWDMESCSKLIEDWFDLYKGVRADMHRRWEEGRRFGYVRDFGGRISYHPGLRSNIPRIRSQAERECYNYTIQGGAQAFMKLGMAKVWNEVLPVLWELDVYFEPLLQNHDELFFELDDDKDLQELSDTMISEALCTAAKLIVPVEVHCAFGKTWAEVEK